jgi:AcrR family transcriptional regulator
MTTPKLQFELYDPAVPRLLPSGRRSVDLKIVSASQRVRLLEAVIACAAARGYAEVTITDVARRAGVSRNTFYEHFPNKDECFLESYREHTEMLVQRIGLAAAGESRWDGVLWSGLRELLGIYVAHPAVAEVASIIALSADPRVLDERDKGIARFVPVYRGIHEMMRAVDSSIAPVSDAQIWYAIGGSTEQIRMAVRSNGTEHLLDLAPEMFVSITRTIGSQRLLSRVTKQIAGEIAEATGG